MSLINKTYIKFLFGFLGIILLGIIVLVITGQYGGDKGLDESDVNFAQPQDEVVSN